ncbi:hypothetical protein D3C87_1217280 [compost metagenome]
MEDAFRTSCVSPAVAMPALVPHPARTGWRFCTSTAPPTEVISRPDALFPTVEIAPSLTTDIAAAPLPRARMPCASIAPSVWIAPRLMMVCAPVPESVAIPRWALPRAVSVPAFCTVTFPSPVPPL